MGRFQKLQAFLESSEIGGWTELLALDFNGGFGWANNQAMLHRAGRLPPYIYLLNPDTEVEPGAITALARVLNERDDVAAVGSQLIEVDGALSASAFSFPSIASEFVRGSQTFALSRLLGIAPVAHDLEHGGEVDWVTGASVMFRRDALEQTGLFDDGFFLYFEEVELMHRVKRAGWKIWFEPSSRVRHIGGASTGVNQPQFADAKPSYWFRSRQRYFVRTQGRGHAFLANLAWLAGFFLVGLPRSAVSSKCRSRLLPGELTGIFRARLWPQRSVSTAAIPDISSAPGRMPIWIALS